MSVFIRLGFAYKKSHEATQRYHASWTGVSSQTVTQPILSPLTLGDTPVVASREGSMSPTSPGRVSFTYLKIFSFVLLCLLMCV